MPNTSWGDAFASAANIQHEELDEDFLRRTSENNNNDDKNAIGIRRVSEFALLMRNSSSNDNKTRSPSLSSCAAETGASTYQDGVSLSEKKKSKKSKKIKKSKKEKKKRSRKISDDRSLNQDNNSICDEDHKACNESEPPPKKKSKVEKHLSSDVEVIEKKTNKQNGDGEETRNTLEGRLHGNAIVLVSKSSGKVFSGTERDSHGDHIQIGTLDSNDEIILFQKDHSPEAINSESSPVIEFPYKTDEDDHCETPLVAYKHIAPLLHHLLSGRREQNPSDLAIYDPYYCNGSVKTHMASLGFTNVYNRKEDCYNVWKQEALPDYDVFMTNPPYSTDHIDLLMEFLTNKTLTSKSKPWLLLMPNWVHKKDFYISALKKNNLRPFYVVPKKRYVYEPPKDFRSKKISDTHKKSSPFVSMWYIWGGSEDMTNELYELCSKKYGSSSTKNKKELIHLWNECDVARSKSALRDLRRKSTKIK